MADNKDLNPIVYKINTSALLTVLGIVLLLTVSVSITVVAPYLVDKTWVEPASTYQKQMYEVADPNIFLSTSKVGTADIQLVHRVEKGKTLKAFSESESVKIIAPKSLMKYITPSGVKPLVLSSKMLLLRQPFGEAKSYAKTMQERLQASWERENPNWRSESKQRPYYEIYELYSSEQEEAFVISDTDGITENWIDEAYKVLEPEAVPAVFKDSGLIYVNNPIEYRVSKYTSADHKKGWRRDAKGQAIDNTEELLAMGFMSRAKLISLGEQIYAAEGCWYCHTDQTRTLVQDTVLNGSESYPAPPSSANEYVYQKITFPGTRRIGPDLSRVGVKRPSRDWHKAHFWSPKTKSEGTIMPAFQHFFDDDPRGTLRSPVALPNYRFEAIYQYLMTKGTRITAPTKAWWLGKDPVRTIDIIEGRSKGKLSHAK